MVAINPSTAPITSHILAEIAREELVSHKSRERRWDERWLGRRATRERRRWKSEAESQHAKLEEFRKKIPQLAKSQFQFLPIKSILNWIELEVVESKFSKFIVRSFDFSLKIFSHVKCKFSEFIYFPNFELVFRLHTPSDTNHSNSHCCLPSACQV